MFSITVSPLHFISFLTVQKKAYLTGVVIGSSQYLYIQCIALFREPQKTSGCSKEMVGKHLYVMETDYECRELCWFFLKRTRLFHMCALVLSLLMGYLKNASVCVCVCVCSCVCVCVCLCVCVMKFFNKFC